MALAALPDAALCFDASPLISLTDAGVLDDVGGWFPPGTCFTAPAVRDEDIAPWLHKHPQNQAILDAPWLAEAAIEEPEDHQFWMQLREELHTLGRDKGEGEAEVLTLCRTHGWTAVINERAGRRAARVHQIASVCTPALIVAAVARGVINVADGWELHCHVHAKMSSHLVLGITNAFVPAFNRAVSVVDRWWSLHPHIEWPAVPRGLDQMIQKHSSRHAGRPGP